MRFLFPGEFEALGPKMEARMGMRRRRVTFRMTRGDRQKLEQLASKWNVSPDEAVGKAIYRQWKESFDGPPAKIVRANQAAAAQNVLTKPGPEPRSQG